jgi:competence protein ComEC
MLRFCLCVLAGGVAMSVLPRLPAAGWFVLAVPAAVVLAVPPRTRALAAILAGAALFGLAANAALKQRLDSSFDKKEFTFIAEITDFTKEESGRTRLYLAPVAGAGLPQRLRLSAFDLAPVPQLGERWELSARLRRPRGNRNPGGFDYEGWLHRNGIGATGYVIAAVPVAPQSARPLPALRRELAARMTALLPADEATAVLLAISVGARHRISQGDWQRYAATGTSHLVAISGLHIGLAAAFAGIAGWLLLALVHPRGNSRRGAALLAACAALGYAAVAGFAVPSQRASLTVALATIALCSRRRLALLPVLALVAVAVFASNPLVLLAPGFQLSFAAVAVLLLLGCRSRAAGPALARWFRELSVLQAALLLGLFPLTAWQFARLGWLAPLANLLVLPVFSVITVPAALLGLVCHGPLLPVGDGLLWSAYYSLRLILNVLEVLAALPSASVWLAGPSAATAVLWLLPLLWVLLPPGWPGRWLAWLALGGAALYRPQAPPAGCVDVVNLDVGQGLATVVRTRTYSLLFDTGPAFRGGGDSAAHVVLPYLRSTGIDALDLLMVSHADQDHAGGVDTVRSALPVRAMLSGEPLASGLAAKDHDARLRACRAGQHWRRDGIDFTVLHPDAAFTGNNASCVLSVSTGGQRALLTGDIEALVERRLLRAGSVLPSRLVVVPHHGSRTSSGAAFVAALAAEAAVVPAGHNNRWGFPKEDVVLRWERAGSRVLTTAHSGAVHHRLCRDGGLTLLGEYRRTASRYWHDPLD